MSRQRILCNILCSYLSLPDEAVEHQLVSLDHLMLWMVVSSDPFQNSRLSWMIETFNPFICCPSIESYPFPENEVCVRDR
jgi:hypothetical protein